jgi:site-specific recombinase XerD
MAVLGSLPPAAEEWLARGRTQKLSQATETARRQDLVAIVGCLAERLDRPAAAGELDRFAGELGRLEVGDLAGNELLDALADYAGTHAPRSVRRLLSTWRGFGRHLVAGGWISANPLDGIEGPKRPEWLPKALEYAELERLAAAAGSSDPRARDPWPERDSALFAVFAGAGVRIAEAISMTVGSVEAADRSPRLRVLGKGNKPRGHPRRARGGRGGDERVPRDPLRAGGAAPPGRSAVRAAGARDYVPFNRQAMDNLVLGWYRRAGVTPPPGSLAHALRHTYATLLGRRGLAARGAVPPGAR